jgi:amino acid transporter
MMVISMDTIYAHPSDMLAQMAKQLGGEPFKVWLCLDAVAVLAAAVLSAITAVSGLMVRLAKDGVIPEILATQNRNGAAYFSIFVFVAMSIALFEAIFDPANPTAINTFGGMQAIAFLGVLFALGIGAILLKLYRPRIPRLVLIKWCEILFSVSAVLIGLIGNIVLTPDVFYYFLAFAAAVFIIVWYTFYRVEFLSFGIWMVSDFTVLCSSLLISRLTNYFHFFIYSLRFVGFAWNQK